VSAFVGIQCRCYDHCLETVLIDGVETVSDARGVAQDRGWYCEIVGGSVVDWAPGHREAS
jgi:hypothetical protein